MKRVVACQCLVALASMLSSCSDAESERTLDSLTLQDVAAYWAVRGQDEEKNNYIHPIVRFRVVNGAGRDLDYVQAMAVFKLQSIPDEPWGNAFTYSISEEPIPPGGLSDVVTLRGDHDVISKDSPEQMFRNDKWDDASVEVFLRVGPSSWRIVEERPVPRQIGAPGLDKFLNAEESEETPLAPPQ